jgi:hypothetical protein
MALTQDTPGAYELGDFNDLPVKASTTIYEGAAVGLASGYARGLVAADGDVFVGFASGKADNSAVATDGAINVRVWNKGRKLITLPGVAVTDIGEKVYADADDSFTLASSGASVCGHVIRYVAANTCVIEFYMTAA